MATERRFTKVNQGIARLDDKFGVQEIIVKPCQHDGDVFLTIRSGGRMIAFSLTFEEFDDLTDIVDKLDKSEGETIPGDS